MMQLATETGVIAGCRACGGTWIDHVVARRVLAGNLPETAKAFVAHVAESAAGPRPASYRTSARRDERLCPACATPLVASPFSEPRITLDLCQTHGTYFDLHELHAVVYAAEMRGAIAQVEAERAEVIAREALGGAIAEVVFGVAVGALVAVGDAETRPRTF